MYKILNKRINDLGMKRKIYSIELCVGAGGLSLGLEKANIHPQLLVDIFKPAIETIKLNRPHWNIQNKDISQIMNDQEWIKQNLKPLQEIDLLSAGLPCQPFSYSGKKAGLDDKRGNLFLDFVKILNYLKPKMLLIENVKGLISHHNGETLKFIISILEKNYKIKYKVLNATDYGVPQKRQRLFIVGVRKDFNQEFKWPKKEKQKFVLKDVLKNVPKSLGFQYSQAKKKILKLIPPGGCWRDLPQAIAKKYMKKSYYLGGGKTGIARRLSFDEPSLTLTTSPMQKQTERCHPLETRPFNIREYARIQTFPDSWKFSGSISSQYKQIGNAVPVNLATKIGNEIVSVLWKIK